MRQTGGLPEPPPDPNPAPCFHPLPANHGATSLGLRVTPLISRWGVCSPHPSCTPSTVGGQEGPTFIRVRRFVQGVREETGAEEGDERQLLHLLFVSWKEMVGLGSEGLGVVVVGSRQASRVGAATCQGRAGTGTVAGTEFCPDIANRVKWVRGTNVCKGETEAHRGGVPYSRPCGFCLSLCVNPTHEPLPVTAGMLGPSQGRA